MATYQLKNSQFFPTPSYFALSLGRLLSSIWKSFTDPETRVFRAADGANLVILACTAFDWSTRVTDRRTDGQTDRRAELRWLRRAIAYLLSRVKISIGIDLSRKHSTSIVSYCSSWLLRLKQLDGKALLIITRMALIQRGSRTWTNYVSLTARVRALQLR